MKNNSNTAIDGKATTKKTRMYAQIKQHGENLNRIFNTGLDPIVLCKKLHRLEGKAAKIALDWCNGDNGIDTNNIDSHTEPILKAVKKILFAKYPDLHKTDIILFNGDAREYALKISDKFVRGNNYNIHTDWGGYGILAPDFSE